MTNLVKDDDAPEVWRVTSTDGKRTLFEGTEEDAYTFVENNFPRIHVEPGVNYGENGPEPDVYVQTPSGAYEWYDGKDWSSDEDTESEDVPDDAKAELAQPATPVKSTAKVSK